MCITTFIVFLLTTMGQASAQDVQAVRPPFTISHSGSIWSFRSEKGLPFWSFGVDCVDSGVAAKDFNPKNPAFSSTRIYGSESEWAKATLKNLRSWGFNSLGAWSDAQNLNRFAADQPVPYFDVLHLGAWGRAPWNDMFAPDMEKAMDEGARSQIPMLRNDPNLVGYFTDNELGWWTDTLFTAYLALPVGSPGRNALLSCLQTTYRGDFNRLKHDWEIVSVDRTPLTRNDWTLFNRPVKMRLRPGVDGYRAVNDWAFRLASRYYSMVRTIVRRYDAKHPILGDRYCQYYAPPIVRASVGKIDVASTNYGAEWPNGDTTRFFLDGLRQLSGRPVIVTEFYECATDNRTGNRNSGSIFPTVSNQTERASAFARYVKDIASRPYVIGAHWFQYNDEPPLGRGDGEDYNMGLVDVKGEPYSELVNAASTLHPGVIHESARPRVSRARIVAPPAPSMPMTSLEFWPKSTGTIDADTDHPEETPFGDLYVCKDADNLYLGLIEMEFIDESLYVGQKIPEQDRPTLSLQVSGSRTPIIVRFGGKDRPATVSVPWVQVSEVPGLKPSIMLRIPLQRLPRSLDLSGSLESHSHGQHMRWRPTILDLSQKVGARRDSEARGKELILASKSTHPKPTHLTSETRQSQQRSRFTIARHKGVWWLVDPQGIRFFSLGVCCVDPGETFTQYDPKNPGFAAYRHYESLGDWATKTIERLAQWHFNTIGAWSDADSLRKPKSSMVFTPILHMGSGAGAPWRDMWDPKIVAKMDQIAADGIASQNGDSRIVGYFSDNELGWWTGALFDWAWKGTFSRAHVVQILKRDYASNWARLRRDFEVVGARDFTQLSKAGRVYLKPGGAGIRVVHDYIKILADRYYFLCRNIIKRHDPKALYLGDRYISGFYPEVAQAAGRYADVVSTNLNADWADGIFSPFYLPALERIAHRPLIITEYYMAARDNRSGDRNDSSGFPVVADQASRAKGFLTSTKIFLQDPNVVGAHWFQYYDEPGKGRGDGENYNMGLVDVDDRPYEPLTSAAASLDLLSEHAAAASMTQKPARPLPQIDPREAHDLESWPRDLSLLPVAGGDPRGDAFAAWSHEAVYIAVHWNEDRFFEALYKSGKVPGSEEPSIIISNGKAQPIRVQLPDVHPLMDGEASIVDWIPGVRSTVVIRIPARWFGESQLAAGKTVGLDLHLSTRGHAYHVHWKIAAARLAP